MPGGARNCAMRRFVIRPGNCRSLGARLAFTDLWSQLQTRIGHPDSSRKSRLARIGWCLQLCGLFRNVLLGRRGPCSGDKNPCIGIGKFPDPHTACCAATQPQVSSAWRASALSPAGRRGHSLQFSLLAGNLARDRSISDWPHYQPLDRGIAHPRMSQKGPPRAALSTFGF